MTYARPGEAVERAGWSFVVWALFVLLILGPLLTVLAFSLTPNVYLGVRPTTLQHYTRLFTDPQLYGPLLRSFEVATIVVAIQMVFGTLIAFATVRRKIYFPRLLDAMSNITIALPSVVVGLALLAFYGPFGPINAFASFALGDPFTLTWTLWILVFAHVLETFPYMVRSITAGLQRMDPHLESAARSLGAGRWQVFRTITLPQLRPSLVAGSVLVLSRSIAEFGATIIVVSAILRTAPVKIYSEAESGSLELAAAYSVILMLVSFTAYVLMTRWLLKEETSAAAMREA
jgi:molybdate transport system permease protein